MPKGREPRGRSRPWREHDGAPAWRELQDMVALSAGAEDDLHVRRISPAQATKPYTCPGCQQEILVGVAHVVVVPRADPAQRRHWHTTCWQWRDRRRPGR